MVRQPPDRRYYRWRGLRLENCHLKPGKIQYVPRPEFMNRRLLLICFSAVLALSGCKKISNAIDHLRHQGEKPAPAKAEVAKPTPTPEPTPVAVATPTPAPIIDKHASVVAFCYHRFEEKVRDSLAITPAEFERQMQALKDAGFTVIPMQDFLAWRRGEKNIPAKSALITLDDGYVSCYDVAWPILKKFNYPFTMFVYIKYVNSGGKSITWDQLAEMRDAGVDIQSHSFSHENLHGKPVKKETAAEIAALGYEGWLKKEIGDSKAYIEKQLGIKVNVFAYPFGVYNQKARDAVKAAGYEAAFTVYGQRLGTSSPSDLLGRYAIEYNKPQIFQSALDMVGGGGGPASYSAAPVVAQVAAASMITVPAEGETVTDSKPTIKANIATMGEVEPNSVEMRISGFGLVPAQYDPKTKMVSYTCAQHLRDKNYTVILSAKVQGKKVETRWNFNFDPNGAPKAQ